MRGNALAERCVSDTENGRADRRIETPIWMPPEAFESDFGSVKSHYSPIITVPGVGNQGLTTTKTRNAWVIIDTLQILHDYHAETHIDLRPR